MFFVDLKLFQNVCLRLKLAILCLSIFNSVLFCQPEGDCTRVVPEAVEDNFKEMNFERIFFSFDTFLSQEIKKKIECKTLLDGKKKSDESEINKKVASIRAGYQSLYQILEKADSQFDQGEFSAKLDIDSFRHLRILSGDQGSLEKCIWSKIDRTETSFGRAVLAKMISTPTTNVELLKSRQLFLKNLIENQNVFENFDSQVSKIKAVEDDLLDILATDPSKDYLNILHPNYGLYWDNVGYCVDENSKKRVFQNLNRKARILDKNSLACNLNVAWALLKQGLYAFDDYVSFTQSYRYAFTEQEHPETHTFEHQLTLDAQRFLGHPSLYNNFALGRLIAIKLILPFTVKPVFKIKRYLTEAKEWTAAIKKSLRQSGAMQEVFQSYAQIFKIIKTIAPEQREALKLFEKSIEDLKLKINKDLMWLIRNLPKANSPGGFLKAYKLIYELRSNMAYVFAALGQLDAYLSMARFYKELSKKKNGLCFAEFVESEYPQIIAQEAWDLSLDPDVAVPSDFQFGGGGLAHDAMLTGPNTGGKSTFMRSIFLSILLAQTFGFGCGNKFVFTPMHGIFSYMNVVDNISKGMSQFYSEAFTVKQGLQRVKELAQVGKFSFFMVDEMFSGTNPEDARSILEAICQAAAEIEKSIWVISTHLPGAAKSIIEKTGGKFGGLMISSSISPQNTVVFDHRVVKGISSVSTAFDVIDSIGFDKAIIENARKIRKSLSG